MRVFIMLIVGVLVSAPALAKDLTQAQKNALNHMAQAQVSVDLCPSIMTNRFMFSLLMTGYDLDFKNPVVESYFTSFYHKQMAPWKSVDLTGSLNPACVAGLFLYGPEGENVKGLVNIR